MLHRLLSTHCRAFQRSLRHVPPLDAFHVVSTTDPLADSDEEYDDHVRYDYGMFIIALDVPLPNSFKHARPWPTIVAGGIERRLRVLNRLRGRSPTPPTPFMRSPIELVRREPTMSRNRYEPYARKRRRSKGR